MKIRNYIDFLNSVMRINKSHIRAIGSIHPVTTSVR